MQLVPQGQTDFREMSTVLSSQVQKMDGFDLAKLWKEYVWQLDQLLPRSSSCQGQWTPTRERLDALTSELVQLMMHLWDNCSDFARIKVCHICRFRSHMAPLHLPYFAWQAHQASSSCHWLGHRLQHETHYAISVPCCKSACFLYRKIARLWRDCLMSRLAG